MWLVFNCPEMFFPMHFGVNVHSFQFGVKMHLFISTKPKEDITLIPATKNVSNVHSLDTTCSSSYVANDNALANANANATL